MPRYDDICRDCGVLEMLGSRDEREVECACGNTASRLPFSGAPYLKGATVVKTWTAERSAELMRKHMHKDENGQKQLDLAAMNRDGAA